MPDSPHRSFSDSLSNLTAELRQLDRDLISNPSPNLTALREFRQAVDSVRLTAWTVQELGDARRTRENPEAAVSFLTAERLRRFSQMVRDLSRDLESAKSPWPAQPVNDLETALSLLRDRLQLIHRAR